MEKERELFEEWCHIDDEFCTHRYTDNCQEYSDDYTQSAWYAFQEQQKQLDLINQYTAAQGASIKMLNDERIKQQKNKDAIKQKLHDIYNVCDEDEAVAMLLDEIQELLK